jgi:hypothetical protein
MAEPKIRSIQAAIVEVKFMIDPSSAYWKEVGSGSELDLGYNGSATSPHSSPCILAMGNMFTANQAAPSDPQYAIGQFAPIDNPIMAWNGTASLRKLISHDQRLASLLQLFPSSNDPGYFTGTALQGEDPWAQWAANWRGCTIIITDKLTGTQLFKLNNAKVASENISVQARAIVANDVQFTHLGQW